MRSTATNTEFPSAPDEDPCRQSRFDSLKWRLFDFSNGEERLLHKGGFERVTDYPQGDRGLPGATQGGWRHSSAKRTSRRSGSRPIIAKGVTGCVRLDERVLSAMEAYNGLAPAHNPPYITGIRLFAERMPGRAAGRVVRDGVLSVRAGSHDALRRAGSLARRRVSGAGDFMARATSSSPNDRRNCSDGRTSPTRRAH